MKRKYEKKTTVKTNMTNAIHYLCMSSLDSLCIQMQLFGKML